MGTGSGICAIFAARRGYRATAIDLNPEAVRCAKTNPKALRIIVSLMGFYMHLGPFAQHVMRQIDARIAALDAMPPALTGAAMAAPADAAMLH